MQKHPLCVSLKVVRLTDIIRSLDSYFPSPYFDRVFIAINRPCLEDDVVASEANLTDPNPVAADNCAS
jgi:hypothetical protein